MTPQRRSRLAAILAVLFAVGLAPAQAPKTVKPTESDATQPKATKPDETSLPARRMAYFTAPDGSRFVLGHIPDMAQVHWAIATWADGSDDPPGLPGLALTTAKASLSGTWSTGSKNPTAERQALKALDDGWQRHLDEPNNSDYAADVIRLDQAASDLADSRMFLRVLAAMPVHRPQVLDRDPMAVFVLTTIEPALANVAKRILERREEQSLRGMARAWMPSIQERMREHFSDPRRRLYAEVLALLMPTSPAVARLEAPPIASPTRVQAIAAWQSSQHPTRTVHVLLGSLDLDRTQAILERIFSKTNLPAPVKRPRKPLRPLQSQRRSLVSGIPNSGIAIAWALPPIPNPRALEAGIRYFILGQSSQLHRSLSKQRPGIVINCQAPWPRTHNGMSLLLLDVVDPSGKPGLAKDVLAACQQIPGKPPTDGQFSSSNVALQREWNKIANDPRHVAANMAEKALMWPTLKVTAQAPPPSNEQAIYDIMKAVFSSQPAIVEGRK